MEKAEKQLKKGRKHRGLIRVGENRGKARQHIKKAERNLEAAMEFREIGYEDWGVSAGFYSAYHCLLAILAKLGYESRNQTCTFALINCLVGRGEVDLDSGLVERINDLDAGAIHESPTVIELRESMQYGVEVSVEGEEFERMLESVRKLLDQAKVAIED